MEVKKIVEGMTAQQVAQVIDENFNALNGEKATVGAVADVQKNVNRSDDNTGILSYPVFDDTEPVAVGDVRRYEGLLYRAKEAGAHDWDPEKWERVTLKQLEDEKLSELGSEVDNKIGETTHIVLTSKDLIKATWNGTSIVDSTAFNMWVVPLYVGRQYSIERVNVSTQSVRTCSEYPSIGKKTTMNSVAQNPFTAKEGENYLVITVTMSSYENGEIHITKNEVGLSKKIADLRRDIEDLESGMQQKLQEVTLKSEKNKNEIIELNKTIGNSVVTREYTSADFYGAIWDGSKIVESNSAYNSFLIQISIGQSVKIESFAALSAVWGFKNKPIIGTTEAPTRIYLSSPTEGTEDIQYLLAVLRISEFISTTATFSAQGVIKEIETLKEGGNLKKLLEGKTIVCFGDSLTEFNGTDGKGYGEHLAELSGAKVVRGGIGGTQLATRATPVLNPTDYKHAYGAVDISNLAKSWANNDWEIVDNAITWLAENRDDNNSAVVERLKNCPIETTDIVIVFGGSNDLNNSTYGKPTDTNPIGNTCGGINQIIDSILSVKPNMVIYFFTPIPRMATSDVWCDDYRVGQTESDGSDLSFRGMVKRIKECAEYNHIPCCDMYNEIGITRHNIYTYTSDGVHPSYGYSLLANRMFGFIGANRNWKI